MNARRRAARRSNIKNALAITGVIALTVTVLQASPATAATFKFPTPHLGKPVAGKSASPVTVSSKTGSSPGPEITRIPVGRYAATVTAGSPQDVPVTHTPAGVPAAKTVSSWKALGSTGLSVAAASPIKGTVTSAVRSASVSVISPSDAKKHHLEGLVLSVKRTDGAAGTAPIAIRVPRKLLTGLYGGDYADRVRWVTVPTSSTTAPQITSADAVASNTDSATNSLVLTPNVTSKAAMVAAVSSPVSSTGTGTFAATSLKPATSWNVSAQTGDFSWQYPMAVPPAAAGPAPTLGLSYDSQSIDGETGSTNNQPSSVGDGWNIDGGGFIERTYVSCSQDDSAKTTVPSNSGDVCWKADSVTLNLQGHSGRLVKDSTTGLWKLQNDDGSRIDYLTGSGSGCVNATYDDDCWRVTTSDGTQYYFGRNELPGWASGKATTNSTWTESVFGNDAGEPCHASTFAASSCTQAWRWNLDYVVDTHGNAEALYYDAETNHYAKNATGSTAYTRGGVLDHIDYGLTSTTVYGTNAATDRVTFGYDAYGRCMDTTDKTCTKEPLTAAVAPSTASAYPDTPFDQLCTSTTSCTNQVSPSFWTDAMLDTVTTSVRNGSTYNTVDTWTLSHSYPDAISGDATTAALLLNKVVHTGTAGTATLSEPATSFAYTAFQNRVWTNGLSPLDRFRISSVTLPTGAVTSVNYNSITSSSQGACQITTSAQETAFIAAANTNSTLCYPVWWVPGVTGAQTGRFDVFRKYVVTSTVTNPKTGGAHDATQTTTYNYTGTPAWRYDTSPGTPSTQRTWSTFAGYNTVETQVGNPSSPADEATTDYTFFQGMDGDRAATSGGTRSVNVTGSSSVADSIWFAGQTRETKVLNGVGGEVLSDTVDTPWASPVEANDGTNVARKTAVGEEVVTSPTSTGKPVTIDTTTTYDNTSGKPLTVDTRHSDGPSTCQTTTYAASNTTAWIIGLPSEVNSVGTSCANASSATYPQDAISDVRTSYDGGGNGSAATKGDATTVQTVDSYGNSTAASAHWATTAATTYDSLGRPTSVTDALGRVTSTAYTPASGGPLTSQVQTDPNSFTNTTVYDPARGNETSATDEAGRVTTATYDALGRRIAVWTPGRAQASNASSPSVSYAYTENQATPLAVATTTLVANGTTTSYALFDGLGQPIQTQAPSEAGGSMVTDTQYDAQGRAVVTNNTYWTASVKPSTSLFVPESEQQIPSETTTNYDAAGRPTAVITSSFGTEQYRTTTGYKGSDEVDTTPPSGGTPTATFTNSLGQKTSLVQYLAAPTTQTTYYSYDASGDMTSMVDPSRNTWTWAYDVLGDKILSTDPDTGTTTSTYDDDNELLTSTDARGQELSYVYDKLGRKTAEYSGSSTSGSELDSWTYDTIAKGNLTSSTSYTGSTPGNPGAAYTNTITGYNAAGQVTGTKVSIPSSAPAFGGTTYTTSLVYNQDGTLVNQFDPAVGGLAAERETYEYDTLGNLDAVSGTSDYGQIVYDGIGQIAQINRDGALANYTTYSYAAANGSVIGIDDETGSGSTNVDQLNHVYVRDADNNITADKESGINGNESQCYTYDALQELTQVWTPATGSTCATTPASSTLGGSTPYWNSYTYDLATGNRTSVTEHNTGTGSDETDTYTYPAATTANPHGVQSISQTKGGSTTLQSYAYDADGNTTSAPGQTLSYDAEGKLASVTTSAGTQNNVYDADGNLLLQTDPTDGSTLYLGDTELHQAPNTSTTTATRTYSAGATPIAERTTTSGSNVIYSLDADVDGTVDLEVAVAAGTVTRRIVDPFGNSVGSAGSWSDTHGFLNKSVSAFSGLTQVGARAYNAVLGRFLSVDSELDPNNLAQNNGYSYAFNSPLTFMDPSGNNPLGNRISDEDWSGPMPRMKPKPAGHKESTPHYDQDYDHPAAASTGYYNPPKVSPRQLKTQAELGFMKAWSLKHSSMPSWWVAIARWQEKHDDSVEALGAVVIAGGGGEDDEALSSADTPRISSREYEAALDSTSEKAALKKFDDAFCPAQSFSSDTRVLLAGGSQAKIGTLRSGQKVLAADGVTGRQTARKIERIWIDHDNDLLDVIVATDAKKSAIRSTEHHPFWDETRHAWVLADDLRAGDQLRSSSGQAVSVIGLQSKPGSADMWDLTVDHDHDFFIVTGSSNVLVHNCGDGAAISKNIADHSNERLAQGETDHYVRGVKASDLHEYVHSVLDGNVPNIEASYNLPRGRSAYWDPAKQAIVIEDPGRDGGTVFTPEDGKAYYDRITGKGGN